MKGWMSFFDRNKSPRASRGRFTQICATEQLGLNHGPIRTELFDPGHKFHGGPLGVGALNFT